MQQEAIDEPRIRREDPGICKRQHVCALLCMILRRLGQAANQLGAAFMPSVTTGCKSSLLFLKFSESMAAE